MTKLQHTPDIEETQVRIGWPAPFVAMMFGPWAAMLPMMRVAWGAGAAPWMAAGLRLPLGPCGVVTVAARKEDGR